MRASKNALGLLVDYLHIFAPALHCNNSHTTTLQMEAIKGLISFTLKISSNLLNTLDRIKQTFKTQQKASYPTGLSAKIQCAANVQLF